MVTEKTTPIAPSFELSIERPKFMTPDDERKILNSALVADPRSQTLRLRLANLLYQLDAFDEAAELLRTLVQDAPGFAPLRLLGEVLLARQTPKDARAARIAIERAVGLATDDRERAIALATLGKAHVRLGNEGCAREAFEGALAADPFNKDAFKRLSALHLRQDRPIEIVDLAERLLHSGVGHSRLLAAYSLALAHLGRHAEARALVGIDTLVYRTTVAAPSGWGSIAAFNAALEAELLDDASQRYDRYGTASTRTWRIDHPAKAASVLVPRLQSAIRDAILDHVERLPRDGHPWLRARPDRAELHNWCVMTDGEGFENWHVHQNGWMSGVYYVAVPDAIVEGAEQGGCLAFGLPEDVVGEPVAAAFGETLVRPAAGMLLLFPSHAYHRTFAHGVGGRRICFAFDILPR